MSPHVGPEVAGLVEALPTLHADEVSLAGLCPECPWVVVAVGCRWGEGGERKTSLVCLMCRDGRYLQAVGDNCQPSSRLC